MPVSTLMVWDLLDWLAWPACVAAVSRGSVSGGKPPPSKFSASWILVSLVSRANAAQRGAGEPCASDPIFFFFYSFVVSSSLWSVVWELEEVGDDDSPAGIVYFSLKKKKRKKPVLKQD